MKIVFLSNYFNHHQRYLCEDLYNLIGDNFNFIETGKITEERLNMGWGEKVIPSYVVTNDEFVKNQNNYQAVIDNADVVIYGSAPYALIEKRLKQDKLTFVYSERLFKKKLSLLGHPVRLFRCFKKYGRYKNVYLLCASAYSTWDYNRLGVFKNKAYKWGYFPLTKKYDSVDNLIAGKNKNSILWCGRFIDWKRPEMAIEVIKRLKEDGYDFTFEIIGVGELEHDIKEKIKKYDLVENVKLLGSMKPTEVREKMEKSSIFLFTSNFNEGWGAVLNESMNSACAVVTSHAIGATPFLVKDKENGLIFKSEEIDDLYNKVKYLLDNENITCKLGKNAYDTIFNLWNSKVASERLLNLIEDLKENKTSKRFIDGPCSKAKVLKNNWYKK